MLRRSLNTLYCKLVYICVFDCVCSKYIPKPSPPRCTGGTASNIWIRFIICVVCICTCVFLSCLCLHHICSHRSQDPRCSSKHLACNLIFVRQSLSVVFVFVFVFLCLCLCMCLCSCVLLIRSHTNPLPGAAASTWRAT